MTIAIGWEAPDFTLPEENRQPWKLSDHRGHNVVLIFYPMDFSPTCTRELRDVTASAKRYADADALVVGISVDSRHAHRAFREAEGLAATLLSDFHPKGEVARLYDAYLEEVGFANRVTVVIDREGIVRDRVVATPADVRDQEAYFAALALCPV